MKGERKESRARGENANKTRGKGEGKKADGRKGREAMEFKGGKLKLKSRRETFAQF